MSGFSTLPRLRVYEGFRQAVGNTPLLKLKAASKEANCSIWGKCEFLNPGGSVKDRPAVNMLTLAEERGAISPGGWIVEASAGNTAIALTLAAKEKNYRVICVMPDTQTEEKKRLLRTLGAVVVPVPFQEVSHINHYNKIAKRLAENINGHFIGQFDNTANRLAHFNTTGQEIWEQTNGDLDGFICAAGTGGTVTGVSTRLRLNRHLQLARDQKENHFISEEAANDRSSSSSSSSSGQTPITMEQILKHLNSNRKEKLALTDVQMQTAADPRGPPADGPLYGGPSGGPLSGGPTRGGPPGGPLTQGGPSEGLRERLKRVLADGGPVIGLADVSGAALFRYFTKGEMQTEGTSIVENIGQHRVTGNLEGFYPDFSCEIKDQEVLHWTHRLLQEEGLPLGMTSGVNVAGAVRLGKALGPQHTIVTMLCDYGHLYAQKQWNPQFLRSLSLPEPTWMQEKPPPEILEAVEASFLPVDGGEEVKKKMNH